MLIDLRDLVSDYSMKITGVIHAGAHMAEEAEVYEQVGVPTVWWIEGNPDLWQPLDDLLRERMEADGNMVMWELSDGRRMEDMHRTHHVPVWALLSDVDYSERTFHVTNNGQSSSLLEFGTHAQVSPDVHFIDHVTLVSRTLDSLANEQRLGTGEDKAWRCCFRDLRMTDANFLNMDLQGAELLALRGAEILLANIDFIYTEINVDELYKGCVQLPELDDWLGRQGFQRQTMKLAGADKRGPGWVGWGDALYVKQSAA